MVSGCFASYVEVGVAIEYPCKPQWAYIFKFLLYVPLNPPSYPAQLILLLLSYFSDTV